MVRSPIKSKKKTMEINRFFAGQIPFCFIIKLNPPFWDTPRNFDLIHDPFIGCATITHRIHGAAIYGNIYHQYTPFMLAYIPYPLVNQHSYWKIHPFWIGKSTVNAISSICTSTMDPSWVIFRHPKIDVFPVEFFFSHHHRPSVEFSRLQRTMAGFCRMGMDPMDPAPPVVWDMTGTSPTLW